MLPQALSDLFYLDGLAIVMISLIGVIGIIVGVFSSRYLQGDSHYWRFHGLLAALVLAVVGMVAADHILVLLLASFVSNALLIALMVHNHRWSAARASGLLAAKTLGLGWLSLAGALSLLWYETGLTSIESILKTMEPDSTLSITALVLIIIAAMTQSAIWPFHRWLISSLNSPTPVSALMHAGLVNGGGFLLSRFAHLYSSQSELLSALYILGIVTVILGTTWKLMQTDVKRMLACSTMSQMGFMIAQCGLGYFPAAVAHLCWHGFFKAYLFLASPSAAQEQRYQTPSQISALSLSLSIPCGILGATLFSWMSNTPWDLHHSSIVLVIVAGITATQLALTLLNGSPLKRLPLALTLSVAFGTWYGSSVNWIETLLSPLDLLHPQPMNTWYWAGLMILCSSWIIMLSRHYLAQFTSYKALWSRGYVKALNASQPAPATMTLIRNHYQ